MEIVVPLLKGDELERGRVYRIRLTDGSWTDGKFMHVRGGENRSALGYSHRRNTHFIFENVRTGRYIEIKSRERIRQLKED